MGAFFDEHGDEKEPYAMKKNMFRDFDVKADDDEGDGASRLDEGLTTAQRHQLRYIRCLVKSMHQDCDNFCRKGVSKKASCGNLLSSVVFQGSVRNRVSSFVPFGAFDKRENPVAFGLRAALSVDGLAKD